MVLSRLTALAFACLIPAMAMGDTLKFKNGDSLTGTFVREEDGKIVFKSDVVGEITVPSDEATVITPADTLEVPAPSEAMADVNSGMAADEGEISPPPDAPEGEGDEESEKNAFDKGVLKAKSYVDYIVPEGWSGKFNFGVSYVDTSTTSQAWNANLTAKKDSGLNHYGVYAFYNFTSQKDANGVQSKTLDKWGGGFTYSRDLTERWFLQSDTDYLRDLVKNINHQVTETVSLGYKVINEEDFTFSLLPGVAGQYIDSEGFNEHWLFYGTFGDELMYRFNETFRVEQDAGIRVSPLNVNDYQAYFNAAFVAKLTDWIDASLNYQYTYDTTVGPGGVKGEQQIIFALGVPF